MPNERIHETFHRAGAVRRVDQTYDRHRLADCDARVEPSRFVANGCREHLDVPRSGLMTMTTHKWTKEQGRYGIVSKPNAAPLSRTLLSSVSS